mmetsp:Transcript_28863/g.56444  ORF Transcript_28863/g.56444 Transcript_28863/m.56444 type:complete len:298 (+) Transcript_28863:119-1012(+)
MATPSSQRGRKRPRSGEDLEGILERFGDALTGTSADAHTLLVAAKRLHQLQLAVERRLCECSVDSLTPHEAVEFIYKRRVRLASIAKNDFEEVSDEEASGSGGNGIASHPTKTRRELVAHFRVGKERLTMTCWAEGPPGPESRYYAELKPAVATGDAVKPLLRCASWDQAASSTDLDAWEALRGQFAVDRRSAADFARSTVLLGIFAELRRKFAKEESDSEEGSPGLVSTISICGMMAEALLPTPEDRLLNNRGHIGRGGGGDRDAEAAAAAATADDSLPVASAGSTMNMALASGSK